MGGTTVYVLTNRQTDRQTDRQNIAILLTDYKIDIKDLSYTMGTFNFCNSRTRTGDVLELAELQINKSNKFWFLNRKQCIGMRRCNRMMHLLEEEDCAYGVLTELVGDGDGNSCSLVCCSPSRFLAKRPDTLQLRSRILTVII